MRRVVCLALLSVSIAAADGIPRGEYRERRAKLQQQLDGVLVLFSADDRDELREGFFQDPNFLYLTGWRAAGSAVLLTAKEEILFIPPRNLRQENYTGRKLGPDDPDVAEKTGFARVLPIYALESNFFRVLETSRHVYFAPGDARAQKLKALAPFHEESSALLLLAKLRSIKSPAEIELITKTTETSVAAHLASWKAMRAGVHEYEIAAVMTGVYNSRGCERSAYAPIVGSGKNGTILHYSENKRRMDAGELVVMDVGAECSDYATDITRTVPVNGKFTARQREIYEIVLGAQKAAIAAIKPGIRMSGAGSLNEIAMNYINSHGKDLYGEPLGKYFIHGLGHSVGLDVHDPVEPNAPLKAGMIITIEPGVYIPEESLGVRIEDTILVTENGPKILSDALPREIEEIEKLVGK